MAKNEKLSPDQNIALKGLNLEEKLHKLNQWLANGLVSREAFNRFSNLWIKRETRKMLGVKLEITPKRSICKAVIEGEIENFLNYLRSNLNFYLSVRDKEMVKISDKDLATFTKYLSEHFHYRWLIDQLLVIGWRYPDKRLNVICDEYIKEKRINYPERLPWIIDRPSIDRNFWKLVWSDDNLVPLDAIWAMLEHKNNSYKLAPAFRSSIVELMSLIKIQRLKEEQRLELARSLPQKQRESQISRCKKRLEAFELLIKASAEYMCQDI